MRWGVRWAVAAFLATGASGLGCASKQTLSLECVPHEVAIYVDGRLLEGNPESIELSRDEPHKVFFKGGPYETQLVVIESREVDGESRLEPADLCSETRFVEMQPDVEIQVETGPPPPESWSPAD